MKLLDNRIMNPSRRDLLRIAGAGAVTAAFSGTRYASAASYDLRGYVQSTMRPPMDALVPKFKDMYPGTSFRLNFANTDQLHTTARVQLASGTAPDILSVWPGSGNPMSVQQLAAANYLLDLSGEPYAQSVPQAFKGAVSFNDKLYFYSPSVSLIGLYVNRKVGEKLGLTQPQTWSEFIALCEKVKQAGLVPLALGTGTSFVTQLIAYALVATTVYSRQPTFDEDMAAGKATFVASEGWNEAFEKYLDLQSRGFFNPNPNGTAVEEQLQMIASGKAAMTIVVSSQNASLFKFAGHQDFVVWPVPALDDASKTMIPAAPGAGFGINAATKDPEGAKAFLRFLAAPEGDAEMSRLMALPSLSQITSRNRDPIFARMLEMVDQRRSVPFMDTRWPNPRVQQTLFAGVQELLAGSAKPADVLARMDAAYKGA